VGTGFDHVCHVLAVVDSGGGDALHAGGAFTTADGAAAGRIARWDGAGWSAVGGTGVASGTVFALANYDDGPTDDLYVGGSFSSAGGMAISGLARWNGVTWSALGGGLGPGATVYALHGSGMSLRVGGSFDSVGNNVAAWTGVSWDGYGSGTGGAVRAIADNFAGQFPTAHGTFAGDFTIAGGTQANRIAIFTGSGIGSWYPLGGGTGGGIRALAEFDDGSGPAHYAGGSFTTSSGGDAYLAKWSCDPGGGGEFCFGTAFDCPCGNAGLPDHGCDVPQGTGGVRLDVVAQTSSPSGATLAGAGFPPAAAPTAIVIRGGLSPWRPEVFGDGLRCVGPDVVRLGASTASGGTSAHVFGHGTLPGTYHYQLWFRSTPISFCDSSAGFNLSSGVSLVW
jgi:hypothetical protein